MRCTLLLAVVLAAGCAAPPDPVSFADALGEPGCHLRLPDGRDLCHPDEQPLTALAYPPSPEWVCTGEFSEPSLGARYTFYRHLLTGETGMAFEDGRLSSHPAGIVMDSGRPGYIGKWNGTNPAFIPLGRSMAPADSLSVWVYDFRVNAEGDAQRAVVRERWTEPEGDGEPWLSYEVLFENQTYTVRGMAPGTFYGELVGFPLQLDVGNEAGRLTGTFRWNGGLGVGSTGQLPHPCTVEQTGGMGPPLSAQGS